MFKLSSEYDVVVVGSGHAGIEAAAVRLLAVGGDAHQLGGGRARGGCRREQQGGGGDDGGMSLVAASCRCTSSAPWPRSLF